MNLKNIIKMGLFSIEIFVPVVYSIFGGLKGIARTRRITTLEGGQI